MAIGARFCHVNVIANDWRALADFYLRVFGCEPVPPERDYSGAELTAGTGVADAALRGGHLRLPGYGADGPTLEIYQYSANEQLIGAAANRRGFGHIAFVVPDVHAARTEVVAGGGSVLGQVVTLPTAAGRHMWRC